MSKRKFSIFKVSDYKGGELSSYTNLSEEEFIVELSELFTDMDDDKNLSEMTLEEIQKEIRKMESDEDFYSLYAGGDGFCGEICEHIENELVDVSIEDFIPQIASYIKENWNW
jgi:hypothetical protein